MYVYIHIYVSLPIYKYIDSCIIELNRIESDNIGYNRI